MRLFRRSVLAALALAVALAGRFANADEKPATDKPPAEKSAAGKAADAAKVIELKANVPESFVEKTMGEGNGSVKVPADWRHVVGGGAAKVSISAPKDPVNINIQVKKLANKALTLEMLHPILPKAVGASFKTFKLISNDIIKTPSGTKMIRMVFEADVNDTLMRFSTFIAFGAENQYTFTYGTLPNLYGKFAEVADQVVVSAKLP